MPSAIFSDCAMRYDIKLTHSKPTYTAVVRGCVSQKELAQFVTAACGEVWSFIRSAGLPTGSWAERKNKHCQRGEFTAPSPHANHPCSVPE